LEWPINIRELIHSHDGTAIHLGYSYQSALTFFAYDA
jgi:hypothetical protein